MYDYNRLSTQRLYAARARKVDVINKIHLQRYKTPEQKKVLAQLEEQVRRISAVIEGREGTIPLWF